MNSITDSIIAIVYAITRLRVTALLQFLREMECKNFN